MKKETGSIKSGKQGKHPRAFSENLAKNCFLVAAILAIVGGVAALGILAAWIVYKLYTRKK